MKKIIFFSLYVILMVALVACGSTNDKSNIKDEELHESKEYMISLKEYNFNVKTNSFILLDGKNIINPYEVSYSQNKKYAIYTKINHGDEPEVYLYQVDKNLTDKLTDNIFIETNPVINNKGIFAYIQSEYSTSQSKVYLNNNLIKETNTSLLYKNLAISDNYLIYSVERFYDNKHFLHWIDLDTNEYKKYNFNGYIQKIKFITNNKVIVQYFSLNSMSMDIGIFELENELFENIKDSKKDELLKDINFNKNFEIATVGNNETDIKLLFNAYYNYYNYQLANPFAYSNNFMGRITWNQSYRLNNLVKLYNLTKNPIVLSSIENIVQALLDSTNEKIGITNNYNPKYSYTTKKYSLDKLTPISLLVDDSKIYNSILFAMDNLGKEFKAKYKNILIERVSNLYNYYDNYFDNKTNMYKFQYGINFWADGVWLPFNQQNIFGIVLLQMYDLTSDKRYKNRAFVLAQKFKDEFVYKDNKLLWHYWSSEFYHGWNKEQNISQNTPIRTLTEDTLYEDLSHAGINLHFILEFQKRFSNEVFSSDDINLLQNTIDSFIYDNSFSRFISGDIEYQKANYRFRPSLAWGLLKHKLLNSFYISLNPYFYPDFDSQAWNMYVDSIDSEKVKNEKLHILINKFDINNILKESNTSIYNYTNIQKYFEIKVK